MSGILIMYVKKYEQSKQRKMNPNKSERERDAWPHSSDATSRSLVFALNSVQPIALTYEKKKMPKTSWKLGFYFEKQSPGLWTILLRFSSVSQELWAADLWVWVSSLPPTPNPLYSCGPRARGKLLPPPGPQLLPVGEWGSWWKLIPRVSSTDRVSTILHSDKDF